MKAKSTIQQMSLRIADQDEEIASLRCQLAKAKSEAVYPNVSRVQRRIDGKGHGKRCALRA